MDLRMPHMGGLEAAQAIRRREQTSGGHVPIVAITAQALPGEQETCRAAGMDGYLAKPIRPDELFAVISSCAGTPVGPGSKPVPPCRYLKRTASSTGWTGISS